MPERTQIPSPLAVQLIECPPRQEARLADPCAMVIFGASGDLTKRLLVPALYNLSKTRLLPEKFALIGVARAEETAESWSSHLYERLKARVSSAPEYEGEGFDEAAWRRLAERMFYIPGDLTNPSLYERIRKQLEEARKTFGTQGNAIFYLALASHFFETVVEQLGRSKLTGQRESGDGTGGFWRRVVIEKPFGDSLASARTLNARVLRTLEEDQIFRIDHFLGKETVQNIMALRFANGMFEPIWNRDRVDHVQITLAETSGVGSRGTFYEATGALRDMVPNHVLALLSMVAMEPPVGFDAASIRRSRADVFTAMPAAKPAQAVRAQYGAGTVLDQPVKAYREEPNVAPASNVETFAAMQLEIDNWRWAGVPFFIRTGKRMARRRTEIAVRFKQAPFTPFKNTPVGCLPANWLIIGIAPDEGISLQFAVKRPGPVVDLASVRMDFREQDWFPREPNVGYEMLLHDVMTGDHTLFMRGDMVEEAWRIVQPVLDAWGTGEARMPVYIPGSEGPLESDGLLARTGNRAWRRIAGLPAPSRL